MCRTIHIPILFAVFTITWCMSSCASDEMTQTQRNLSSSNTPDFVVDLQLGQLDFHRDVKIATPSVAPQQKVQQGAAKSTTIFPKTSDKKEFFSEAFGSSLAEASERSEHSALGEVSALGEAASASSSAVRDSRSSMLVNADGTTTLQLSTEGTTALNVLLILRNHDGTKAYASGNNQWPISSDGKTVSASGRYAFYSLRDGDHSQPTWEDDEVWTLDAITGGEWDEGNRAYTINKTLKVPNHMYAPGEQLVLGRDIIVPFSLGTSTVGTSMEDATEDRKWGVRMAVVNDNPAPTGSKVTRLVCIDSHPDFRPYGSLLCMRFKNAMHNIRYDAYFKTDQLYDNQTFKTPTFSYMMRGLSLESTSSTTGGWIDLRTLGAPNRLPLPWYGYTLRDKADGSGQQEVVGYRFDQLSDKPFRQYVQFDRTTASMQSGYPLLRLEKGKTDTEWSPYYYVWMKSLDESREKAFYGSTGLTVRLDLYNATMEQAQGERVAFASDKVHKSGRAYFRSTPLEGEIMLSPMAYAGVDLTIVKNDVLQWPKRTIPNEEMVAGRYKYDDIRSKDKLNLTEPFQVAVPQEDETRTPLNSELRWVLTDEHGVSSIFPPQMPNINSNRFLRAGQLEVRTETVRIGGVLLKNVKSFYYRRDYHDRYRARQEDNYNTYYALRYVGTPFCEAVRYTEYGEWYSLAFTAENHVTPKSRFVMHAKQMGLNNLDPNNEEQCKRFLINVIGAGNYVAGNMPQNEFWGNDFWNPDKTITYRELHVPGNPANTSRYDKPNYIGRMLSFLILQKPDQNGWRELGAYTITATGQGRNYEFTYPFTDLATSFRAKQGYRPFVFPFLAPLEYKDPPWVDDLRKPNLQP